ncbi:MAG: cupin domain-containing protein, partial [Methanospirillum sp.]|nr:cupin domain-containing protein [Methanospirillum sp.]
KTESDYMNNSFRICATGLTACLLLSLITLACTGDTIPYHEASLLTQDNLTWQDYGPDIGFTNIIPLLNEAPGIQTLSNNLSIALFKLKPGAVLSPEEVLPVPEVIYITQGTARITAGEEEVTTDAEKAVYIPSNVTRIIENPGDITLRYFSCTDWTSARDGGAANTSATDKTLQVPKEEKIHVISEKNITPAIYGNNSIGEEYSFYRLVHPAEGPYPVSYDLGTVHIPVGTIIPDHYVEGSSQLMTILQGKGNISVGCSAYPVESGDMFYVAPGAVMNISVGENLHFMMVTSPYYKPENEHLMMDVCDYV